MNALIVLAALFGVAVAVPYGGVISSYGIGAPLAATTYQTQSIGLAPVGVVKSVVASPVIAAPAIYGGSYGLAAPAVYGGYGKGLIGGYGLAGPAVYGGYGGYGHGAGLYGGLYGAGKGIY